MRLARRNTLVAFFVGALFVGAAAACGRDDPSEETGGGIGPAPRMPPAADGGTPTVLDDAVPTSLGTATTSPDARTVESVPVDGTPPPPAGRDSLLPAAALLPPAGSYSYLTTGQARISGIVQSTRALPTVTTMIVGSTAGGSSFDRDLRHPGGEGARLVTTLQDSHGGLALSMLQVSVTAVGTSDVREFAPSGTIIWFPDAVNSGSTNRFELKASGATAQVEQTFTERPDGGRDMVLLVQFSGQISGSLRVTAVYPAGSVLQDTEEVHADVTATVGRFRLDYTATRSS